jgi:hypothetical protein
MYVALIGRNVLEYVPGSREDLIQKGRLTAWICETGTAEDYETFDDFIRSIKGRKTGFKGKSIEYEANGAGYRLVYRKGFYINRKKKCLEYDRLDTPYGNMKRKAGELEIKFNGKGLNLDYEKGIRQVGS